MRPRLFIGGLTGRVYLSTRYRTLGDDQFVAISKTDVTEEFENACLAYLARLAGGHDGHRFLGDGLSVLILKVNSRVEDSTHEAGAEPGRREP